jgi:AraC family transcriptional regulator of adaptative response/methylated-DNA-[protein]-cysteine methyltransferase
MVMLSKNLPQPHRDTVRLHPFIPEDSNARINYAIEDSSFGDFFIATTNVGICQLGFINSMNSVHRDLDKQLENLIATWPNAKLTNNAPQQLSIIRGIFEHRQPVDKPLTLHVIGSRFQIQVWQALLNINSGCRSSYGEIAKRIGNPRAARAVGSAIGANPIALLIPCHRVVRHNGDIGGYRYGISRKRVLLEWESTGQI